MKAKVFLVEDDQSIVSLVQYNLQKEGFNVQTSGNGEEAIKDIKNYEPDLILLDWMLPDLSGLDICKSLKKDKKHKNIPIIMLTAKGQEEDKVSALNSGADDYITKPFGHAELIARINALLRRKSEFNNQLSIMNIGDLCLDSEKFILKYKDNVVDLTKKEFLLYELLLSKPGRVFKRNEILEKVWGNDVIIGDRTIDVHIRKIRSKTNPNYIKTIKGVGYKFEC